MVTIAVYTGNISFLWFYNGIRHLKQLKIKYWKDKLNELNHSPLSITMQNLYNYIFFIRRSKVSILTWTSYGKYLI